MMVPHCLQKVFKFSTQRTFAMGLFCYDDDDDIIWSYNTMIKDDTLDAYMI